MSLKPFVAPALTAALLLVTPGCAEEEPPGAEAEQGLEQAADAIGRMDERREELEESIDELQEQLRDSLDKHLTLLDDRLSAYEARIIALPAEREAELRRAYSQLIAQTGEVKQLFEQWTQASGDRAIQLREQLQQARERLDAAFEQFEQQLAEAEAA